MAGQSKKRTSLAPPAPGTPGWWATRPIPPSGPRRGRPPRSFERIVEAASELVDEAGTGAFSMRVLAERLETSTATLYRHVAGKDELMVYVVDRLFGELDGVPGQGDGAASWQDALRGTAARLHRALSQHPNLVPLFVRQIPIGPNALAARERTIAILARFGFSPELAARAFTTVAHYAIGFAALEYGPDAPGPEQASALGDYYRGLDAELYPAIVASAAELTEAPLEEEFLEGLQFIVDGIDRRRRRR
jgi:AcrR family transcriptional regulator